MTYECSRLRGRWLRWQGWQSRPNTILGMRRRRGGGEEEARRAMTLIVALRGTDGTVIAADSRGTIGDPRGLTAINDTQVKLFKLSNLCALGISGASELAAAVVDLLRGKITSDNIEGIDDIMAATRQVARQSYDDWFQKFPLPERPGLLLTLTGYNAGATGDSKTYLLTSSLDFAPQLLPSGNCLAGIVQYAVYLLHRFYDPGMSVEQLKRLAAYLIAETATQDPKVGGPIRMAVVRPVDGYQDIRDAEVAAIVAENETQSQAMREFFLKPRAI